jgi:tetratricopeptide (TPR) repeat protein
MKRPFLLMSFILIVLNPINGLADTDAVLSKAVILLHQNKTKQSIQLLKQVLAESPDNADALYYIAKAYLLDKKPELALKEVSLIAVTDPSHAQAYLLKGIILFRLKRYDEALDSFKKSVQTDTSLSAPSAYWTGMAYESTGDYNNAKIAYTSVVESAPGTDEAMLSKERLRVLSHGIAKHLLYNSSIYTGMQYDSNVVDQPTTLPSNKSDERWVVDANAGLDYKPDMLSIKTGLELNGGINTRLHDFDTKSALFFIQPYKNAGRFLFSVMGRASYMVFGKYPYISEEDVMPAVTLHLPYKSAVDVYAELKQLDFLDQAKQQTQGRSTTPLGDITFGINLGKDFASGYLKGGYGYETYDARGVAGNIWDSMTQHVLLSGGITIIRKLSLDVNLHYADTLYTNQPVTPQRHDKIVSAGINLSYQFVDTWYVSLSDFYTDNRSNQNTYAYNRDIASLFLTKEF